MKHLIFGRNSWLGSKIKNYLNAAGEQAEISAIDVTNLEAIEGELTSKRPQIVINAAAKTGRPNIDWCEEHKSETLAVNTIGPLNLLKSCLDREIYLVQLASGCIFDNVGYDKPVSEQDLASPPSFYSWTKYWADEVLKNFPVLILRLRMPCDKEPNPRNLITKLANYPKIIDVQNSITVVDDFLYALRKLMGKKCIGIYNVTNPGAIRHEEIMAMYQEIVEPGHQYQLIAKEDLQKLGLAKAGRSNCVLSTEKLEKEGINLPPVKEALKKILIEYAARLANK